MLQTFKRANDASSSEPRFVSQQKQLQLSEELQKIQSDSIHTWKVMAMPQLVRLRWISVMKVQTRRKPTGESVYSGISLESRVEGADRVWDRRDMTWA